MSVTIKQNVDSQSGRCDDASEKIVPMVPKTNGPNMARIAEQLDDSTFRESAMITNNSRYGDKYESNQHCFHAFDPETLSAATLAMIARSDCSMVSPLGTEQLNLTSASRLPCASQRGLLST